MLSKKCLLLLLLITALVVGCSSQDNPSSPKAGDGTLSAIIRGGMSSEELDFEIPAELGKGLEELDQGSILVRGRNLNYDSDLGALTVDLSVFNDSDGSYPEPVGLTFVQFVPGDVTILGSDNDQNGVGALVLFDFDDADDSWSPGEESLSRTVSFSVASGVSLGFVARIDVGGGRGGGAIGGLVWHDENEDGMIDPDEDGVGGVTMTLFAGQPDSVNLKATTITAADGSYLFVGQEAGFYTVGRQEQEGLMGTTEPEMSVILVDFDGTVPDFLLANFGVTRGDKPPVDGAVRVGDYVDAKGHYQADPHRLSATKFKVKQCHDDYDRDDDDDDDGDDDDDDGDHDGDDGDDDGDDDDDKDRDHDGCRQNDCWGRLAGPVTAVNWEEGYFEIMGTKVYGHEHDKDRDNDHDYESGVRFRVDATRDLEADDAMVFACKKPHWWNGNRDRIRGFVQEVVRGDDGQITGVIVLNTLIEIMDERHDSEE